MAFLKDPQELCLEFEGDFADFVEEYGAAVGCPEETECAVNGACECASDVAEQLAFKQLAGKGSAINGHKDVGRAIARVHCG